MRAFAALFAFVSLTLSLAACAEGTPTATTYEAGVHYMVLDTPVRTSDSNKIEVTEVFWYGCGHCFKFDPLMQSWKKKQADDIKVVLSPAMWNGAMETHARVFYTAQALGVLDKAHEPLFKAINLEKKRLVKEAELVAFFEAQGIEADKFNKTFKSFGVTSQVKQANARARSYKVSGTPEIIVNGKYRVSTKMAGNQINMLKIVDYLVAKERG